MASSTVAYLRSAKAARTLSRAFSTSPFATLTASYTTSTASPFSPSSLLSASSPTSSSSSTSPVQLSSIAKPGGRQSINGIVATVFGASGFVGRYAVNYLGRIGSQVIVPYRGDGMNVRHLKLAGDLGQIVPMPCDLADEAQVMRALARSNVVINLIGASQETTNFSYDDVHVKVAYRIAKLAKQAGVERFVHVSAVGASPKSTSSFFQSKFAGEEVVKSFYPNATILRPCTVYGPEDRFLNWIATIGQRFVALPTLNGGSQLLQPIHVRDVANAILQAVVDDKSLGKVYELGGPDVFTYANVVKLVSHSAFMDIKLASLPEPVLRLYGRLLGGRTFTYSEDAMFGAILSRVAQIASRVRFTGIYHEDLVDQALVNLVADPSLPGCKELDVTPASLIAEIDQLMIPHRPIGVAPERFPDADKLKEKATPAGALDRM